MRNGHVLTPKPSCSDFSIPNMTGRRGCQTMEMTGGSSVPYLARTSCVPLFCALFSRGRNRTAFRLPGAGGDHFPCMVEPSPGHIQCRILGILMALDRFAAYILDKNSKIPQFDSQNGPEKWTPKRAKNALFVVPNSSAFPTEKGKMCFFS